MLSSTSADPHAWLRRQLADCAYPGYVYGYPHKKAYRPLARPVALEEAWAGERLDHLYCYVHVPFCGQRCSFCNLFTYVPGPSSPARPYLDALAREMEGYARALPRARFDHLYLGGGTPTYLTTAELRWLVARLRDGLGIDPAGSRGCIEASPETVDADKVSALREMGFQRVSLGVQSFVAEELQQVNRRFDFALNHRAVRLIGDAGFPHFNIDLIYGLPGQTLASWEQSLSEAAASPATSLFLYPLYIRPMTGLSARRRSLESFGAPTTHQMAAMYDRAQQLLSKAGFRQWTMRQFRRDRAPGPTGNGEGMALNPSTPPFGGGGGARTAECEVQPPVLSAPPSPRGGGGGGGGVARLNPSPHPPPPRGEGGPRTEGAWRPAVRLPAPPLPAGEGAGGEGLRPETQPVTGAPDIAGEYNCQSDGMVGLGAGARSYTTSLHYSTPWRMVARNIRDVIDDYVARLSAGDSRVRHGFVLDDDERRRRFVIQSLLFDGLDLSAFTQVFNADARTAFAGEWEALLAEGCARAEGGTIRLTPRGVRHADVVGQLFFSERVSRLIAEYEYDT